MWATRVREHTWCFCRGRYPSIGMHSHAAEVVHEPRLEEGTGTGEVIKRLAGRPEHIVNNRWCDGKFALIVDATAQTPSRTAELDTLVFSTAVPTESPRALQGFRQHRLAGGHPHGLGPPL
ncbi:MAG: hypothetical protein ABFE13_23065 [Phycisphaerales bacterium]